MKIALLNCEPMPEHDPDEAPLLAALERGGHEARAIPWNGHHPEVLKPYDAVLLRATWDYYHSPERFLAWLEAASAHTAVLNPVQIVRANAHKGYLEDLARRGVPTVPTEIVRAGSTASLADLATARSWTDVVVKPAVGAGSYLTLRTTPADPSAQTHLEAILADRDAMVQPFVHSVATTGERSVICFRGVPHHAVHKHPRFKGDQERVERAELTDALDGFATRVLEAADATGLLYARVDCFETEDGAPLLSELELIEPSLYFDWCEGAATAFVTHLEHHLALTAGA
ncbi:MAG: RimK family alpha-L-glutamate ligase [Phycisphaerales bacterium JB040]